MRNGRATSLPLVALTMALALVSNAAKAHPGTGIVVDSQNQLYVADPERDRVWVLQVGVTGSLSAPTIALDRHVHALGLAPDGSVLAEAQSYDPDSGRWHSELWHLDHPKTPVVLLNRHAAGFVTATSPYVDEARKRYAWDADMVDRAYSRLLIEGEAGERERVGGAWRDPEHHDAPLLGNVGDLLVLAEGRVLFTDFSCVREFREGALTALSCDGLLSKPLFSFTFGQHNHLRGLTRGDAGVTWVANYAARRVVRIDADGRQSVALASDRKFRPVGVFKHGQR
ncbi:MAG: hypothetical protein AAF270_14630, partial [Pseudomonadota bacterium]